MSACRVGGEEPGVLKARSELLHARPNDALHDPVGNGTEVLLAAFDLFHFPVEVLLDLPPVIGSTLQFVPDLRFPPQQSIHDCIPPSDNGHSDGLKIAST
jgi:hypothetical protein